MLCKSCDLSSPLRKKSLNPKGKIYISHFWVSLWCPLVSHSFNGIPLGNRLRQHVLKPKPQYLSVPRETTSMSVFLKDIYVIYITLESTSPATGRTGP